LSISFKKKKKIDGEREVGCLGDNRCEKMRMEVMDFEPNTPK